MDGRADGVMDVRINKRGLLAGGGLMAGLSALPPGLAQAAPASAPVESPPGWARLRVGDVDLLAVSDGPLSQGDPVGVLKGKDPDVVRAALRDEFLDESRMTLDQNAVVILSGGRVVLVDAGTGGDPLFGDRPGRLVDNLHAAQIDPRDITDVLLTHAHPDHIWGLTDASGAENFPDAQVHLSEADYAFFSDPANDGHPLLGPFMAGGRRRLDAVAGRLNMVRDGQEVLPGIVALSAPGHTPGHTVFRLQSGNDALLLAGDLAHHHAIFTRYPEIRFAFDTDPGEMVATRKRFFDMLATDRIRFLAYHFPFPGAGHLARWNDAYRWVPASLDTI